MAFNPSSTIYLCNVPIDNTYQNQIFFSSRNAQNAYFSERVKKTFLNYLTVRKSLPDGAFTSSVRVDANIDELYECNYMYYQNANHGTRYFYAFITKLNYVSEGTTEICFETDVYQTWWFDVTLKLSYVVREHSVRDSRGENIVPEKFNFQDYYYTKYPDGATSLGEYGYLVTTTESYSDTGASEITVDSTDARKMSGIYQGLYFYYFSGANAYLKNFLKNVDKDCVLSVNVIPEFNVGFANIGLTEKSVEDPGYRQGWIQTNSEAPWREVYISPSVYREFEGYEPKNNKLFTSPYIKIIATNNSGEEAEYSIEDFDPEYSITFKMYGDISINPSVSLIPMRYKGVEENYMAGISIKNFPQCSFNTDTFKLWLTKNQFSTALGTVTGVAEVAGGIAMIATGAGTPVGVGLIAHGATGVMNTMNNVYQASTEPNKGHTGGVQNNLLTAIGRNKFDFYVRRIKREYAETIDNFFTMYGYATNKLKIPNISSRPYFNYVQTVDCNIEGGIPTDDMQKLKSMFNNGVTFWKSTATVGDYAVDNRPVIVG